jgi:hypothetical protein
VVNRSNKPEQRKAYLLRPQANLTMQGLIERCWKQTESREMIQAQQRRLNLLQSLMTASDESVRLEI